MKELERIRQGQGAASLGALPAEVEARKDEIEELAAKRAKMMEKVAEEGVKGKDAPHDLARAVRDEIAEEYRELADKSVKNRAYFDETTIHIVDFSQPGADLEVAKIDGFSNLRTLILTGGGKGAPVNLGPVLKRASGKPLETLYIINFRNFVTRIPPELSAFTGLKNLGLFNNQLDAPPALLPTLTGLETLYLDANPVSGVAKAVGGLKNLKELGIANTGVTDAEAERIASLLGCKVLR
jgi:hypothetical protein